jgi:ribonuclease VapC
LILDTSAIAAVLFRERPGQRIMEIMQASSQLRMSTVNLTELLIVANRTGKAGAAEVEELLALAGVIYLPPDENVSRIAASARGRFPINFGDCFCYALAIREDDAILTLDAEFAKTDARLIPI